MHCFAAEDQAIGSEHGGETGAVHSWLLEEQASRKQANRCVKQVRCGMLQLPSGG
jgi:hypothetical protein